MTSKLQRIMSLLLTWARWNMSKTNRYTTAAGIAKASDLTVMSILEWMHGMPCKFGTMGHGVVLYSSSRMSCRNSWISRERMDFWDMVLWWYNGQKGKIIFEMNSKPVFTQISHTSSTTTTILPVPSFTKNLFQFFKCNPSASSKQKRKAILSLKRV